MKKTLVLFDIDGTLANDSHRVQYAIDKQWVTYFEPERMMKDTLLLQGWWRIWLHVLRGHHVGYLTGRRIDRGDVTRAWFKRKFLPRGKMLLTRGFTDKMPLANFKADHIGVLMLQGNYSRVILLDDDPEVIRLVGERHGRHAAIQCRWYEKPVAMVKAAQA